MPGTVERILRFVYERSTLARAVALPFRVRKATHAARAPKPAFNDDTFLADTVSTIIDTCSVSHFVETGTYLGHTTRFLADRFPALSITTIEANPVYVRASAAVLRRFSNVRQLEGNSSAVLPSVLAQPERLPFFFLDAHWNDYLPLADEMQLIAKHCPDAVILIHDFQVPGQPHFRFDTYHDQPIGLASLEPTLAPTRSYEILLPCYRPEEVYGSAASTKPPLRGHCLIFQGATSALAAFRASAAVQRYSFLPPRDR